MKINKKDILIINCILIVVLLAFVTYAWMVKDPSFGQSASYNRLLTLPGIDFDAEIYAMVNEEFVEQDIDATALTLENMEPGSIQRYKIDIHNNTDVDMRAKITLSKIEGNINKLGSYIFFGVSVPIVRNYQMSSSLIQSTVANDYYLTLLEGVEVPASGTATVYWYIQMSGAAKNDLMNETLSIKKIIISSS